MNGSENTPLTRIWSPADTAATLAEARKYKTIQDDLRTRLSDDDIQFDSDMAYMRALADAIEDELDGNGGTVAPPPETPAFDDAARVEVARKRSWFERLTPWWVLAGLPGLILGAALWFSVPGNADPDADQKAGFAYGRQHATEICAAISAKPTVGGVLQEVLDLSVGGLSPAASGAAVAYAVMTTCDQHGPVLEQFIAKYAGPQPNTGPQPKKGMWV